MSRLQNFPAIDLINAIIDLQEKNFHRKLPLRTNPNISDVVKYKTAADPQTNYQLMKRASNSIIASNHN